MRVSVGALGELCDVTIGRTPARDRADYWGGTRLWLSIADMAQGRNILTTTERITDRAVRECGCKLVAPGTVLLSFKLSIGKVGIAGVPLYTNEAIAALPVRDAGRLNPEYLYHALRALDLTTKANRASKGMTLNKAKIEEFTVPLPAMAEQRRIAKVLTKAEALGAMRREALRKLLELRTSTFHATFGQWSARGPTRRVALADLLMLPLRNGISPSTAGTFRAKVLTLSAVTGVTFDPDAWKFGTFAAPLPSDRTVEPRDFLIARGNGNLHLVGRGKFPTRVLPDVAFPDTIIAARIDTTHLEPAFLEALWDTPDVRADIESLARTTNGTFKINQSMLEDLEVPLPPLRIQRQFAKRLARIDSARERQQLSLAGLHDLLASLTRTAFAS